jgi:mono/diheme cytochrome c family protein
MRRVLNRVGVLAFAITVFACGSGDQAVQPVVPAAPAPAPASAPAPVAKSGEAIDAEATQIFETRCYTCHGMKGMGDGPGSAGLTPKPRNFTDPTWQASVTDDHINKIIRYGGAAVGRSPMMPGNPDLIAKPEIVAALVQHVRSLVQKP